MEVYSDDTPLPLTPGPSHQLADNTGTIVVEQSCLDVEIWLNNILQKELKKQDLEYRSLVDYDVQLYEVRTQVSIRVV